MPLTPRVRFFAAALGCFLMTGCQSDFHVVLFNNTDDPVIVRLRENDPHPQVVYAEVGGEITGVSTDDFTVERQGRVLHYRVPTAFTYPSEAVRSRYEHKLRSLGKTVCFQLAPDNRIYLLGRRDALDVNVHVAQPNAFPLVPR